MDDLEYMICAQFLKYDIEEDMITPMQKRSPERLNQIRHEGKAYTNASKYAEGDVEVPLMEIEVIKDDS